jgi:hypothetical protein
MSAAAAAAAATDTLHLHALQWQAESRTYLGVYIHSNVVSVVHAIRTFELHYDG